MTEQTKVATLFHAYKITEIRDGAVYKTAPMPGDIWVETKPHTEDQMVAIAKKHGGDMLVVSSNVKIERRPANEVEG